MSAAAERRRGRTRFLVLAIAYAALIFAVSQIPGRELARVGITVWDKAVHALEYLPLGALIAAWLASWRRPAGPRARLGVLAIAVAAVFAWAVLDEIHQAFVPGRQPAAGDVVADLVGGLLGGVLALAAGRRSAGGGGEPLDELDPGEDEEPVEALPRDP